MPCPSRVAQNRRNEPRSSGTVTANTASRDSPISARSATRRRRSKFMFAPQATAIRSASRAPVRSTQCLSPAIASAPAGSRMLRVSSKTSLIAAQTASESTRTISSTSSRQRRKVSTPTRRTAVRRVGVETFRLCRELVDEIVRVDSDAVCAAIKDVFEDTRSILEPAGALAIAGLKHWVERTGARDANLVAVACGANMNFDRLRLVAERAEIGESREAVFAVTVPEERGSFLRFCATLAGHGITEFNYRIADGEQAHLFVGVQVGGRGDAARIAEALRAGGFATLDLTDDELAKQHLRHMIGGRSSRAHDESLYRFEFPERPGALLRFLSAMSPTWHISLFHYRHEGAGYGHVLVGIQVPSAEMEAFRAFLGTLGYPHRDETANPAYHLFLRG